MKPIERNVTTAAELLQLPRGRWRYELVGGQLRVMTPAGHVHGMVAARIGARLTMFVDANRLGVTFAAPGLLLRPAGLAVEVVSPSDRPSEVAEKTEEWLRAGCRAVVVVDPATTSATVHRSGVATERFESEAELSVSELLPGWAVALRDIFHFSIS